jgi:hypothetical protein
MDDDVIRAMVARLSRRHPSGGKVIERAAILAEGADLESIVKWILAHDGQPEARAPARSVGGLHGARFTASVDAGRAPARYVLPAGALVEPASAPQLALAVHPAQRAG